MKRGAYILEKLSLVDTEDVEVIADGGAQLRKRAEPDAFHLYSVVRGNEAILPEAGVQGALNEEALLLYMLEAANPSEELRGLASEHGSEDEFDLADHEAVIKFTIRISD